MLRSNFGDSSGVALDLHHHYREQNLTLNIGRYGRNWGRAFFLTDEKPTRGYKGNRMSKVVVGPLLGPILVFPSPFPFSCSFCFSVCTQLLVSRPDEENISSYLQLIDKCLIHEVSCVRSSKTVVLITWKLFPKCLFM